MKKLAIFSCSWRCLLLAGVRMTTERNRNANDETRGNRIATETFNTSAVTLEEIANLTPDQLQDSSSPRSGTASRMLIERQRQRDRHLGMSLVELLRLNYSQTCGG